MAKLCQMDFETVRPHEYFPETFIEGECDACGETTFVARVTKNEAGESRQSWLERRQAEDFEQAMRGPNAPDPLGD